MNVQEFFSILFNWILGLNYHVARQCKDLIHTGMTKECWHCRKRDEIEM